MDVKEYTCLKKNDEILYEYARFIKVEDLLPFLKKQKINRFQIEYFIQTENEKITYALFFYKNNKQIGAVFPYKLL